MICTLYANKIFWLRLNAERFATFLICSLPSYSGHAFSGSSLSATPLIWVVNVLPSAAEGPSAFFEELTSKDTSINVLGTALKYADYTLRKSTKGQIKHA